MSDIKTEVISFRTSPEEAEWVKAEAESRGLSKTAYMQMIVKALMTRGAK